MISKERKKEEKKNPEIIDGVPFVQCDYVFNEISAWSAPSLSFLRRNINQLWDSRQKQNLDRSRDIARLFICRQSKNEVETE
ncbi:hypothetical protein HNY73_002353 [Argiope bruennichi]|uniref:Uncharacterized protein n=1 Tax=Argiope bruennichi TaxID=94029 RepID=A0A8T0FVQ7_ARGBR|nr:hypothetical protein HNY73_002353 [Argiope bruennichi]